MLIKESFLLVASDADVLAAPSRLAAIPRRGVLTIEASTTDFTSVNFGQLTLQLPEGDIPFENLHIPANGLSTANLVMDSDTELLMTMDVNQGGHVLLAYTETGATNALIIVTLSF